MGMKSRKRWRGILDEREDARKKDRVFQIVQRDQRKSPHFRVAMAEQRKKIVGSPRAIAEELGKSLYRKKRFRWEPSLAKAVQEIVRTKAPDLVGEALECRGRLARSRLWDQRSEQTEPRPEKTVA